MMNDEWKGSLDRAEIRHCPEVIALRIAIFLMRTKNLRLQSGGTITVFIRVSSRHLPTKVAKLTHYLTMPLLYL